MTSALIALVFLVVWYGGMLLAFRLIDRQIDDPASPEGRREKTFAMIFIGLGAGVVLWGGIGPLTALAYRIDTIRPMVAQCRAGGEAEVCADLARMYRDGLQTTCALPSDVIRPDCVLVAKNADKAEEFTRLACAAGRAESCLRALPPPDSFKPLQPVKARCAQGDLLACDDYFAQYPRPR